jgi:hypothetical protein
MGGQTPVFTGLSWRIRRFGKTNRQENLGTGRQNSDYPVYRLVEKPGSLRRHHLHGHGAEAKTFP